MVAPVSGVVEKASAILAVPTVVWTRSVVPDDALHPVEHGLRKPSRTTADGSGLLDPEPLYGSQES